MYWDQLTSPQIQGLDRHIPVVLPIAATEQHGPHLPLATDRLIGEHFCRELDRLIPGEVLILPTVSVGCSEHHTDFAGTLSLQHETFLHVLMDIGSCVSSYGFKNLLLLNSHGGNQAIGQSFVEIFGYRHPQIRLAMATWWRIALEELKGISTTGPGGTGHAGEFETSLMMVIAPALINQDKIGPKANVATFNWAEGDLLTGPSVALYRRMQQMTPTGVFGEPAAAAADKGRRITEVVAGRLREIVLQMGKEA